MKRDKTERACPEFEVILVDGKLQPVWCDETEDDAKKRAREPKVKFERAPGQRRRVRDN